MRPIFIVALAFALLAPTALAHVESMNQGRSLVAGPYYVYFEPKPSPPFAGQMISMVAQVSEASTGALARGTPTSVLVAGPDFTERKPMENDGTGYLIASMTLPERGNYSVRILVTDPRTNETYAAQTEFEVYANIPYRIRPVDQVVDAYEGETSTLAFEVVDPISLEPKDVTDLTLLMQHWTEDHTALLGEETKAGTKVGKGVFRYSYMFPDMGMYHMRFASDAGGFNYGETPPLHIYAISATDAAVAREDDKQTPAAPLAFLLVLAGVVALLRKR